MCSLKTTLERKYVIFAKRFYTGTPLESGGTSIQGKAAPAIRSLVKAGAFDGAKTILDYGAGKYGRNAEFLREAGFKVFAYDPFNGKDPDGWKGVANKLPTGKKFDVGFSCFVLNVVPKHIEKEIVSDIKTKCKKTMHVVRNMDIYVTTIKALERGDKLVTDFYINEYKGKGTPGHYDKNDIIEFCKFGVQTSKGFQRITDLEGYTLAGNTSNYKVFV